MEEFDIASVIYFTLSIIGIIMAIKIRHIRKNRKSRVDEFVKGHVDVIDDKKNDV